MDTPVTDTPLPHQIGLSVAIVYAIQFLKRSQRFPWLSTNSDQVNRWVNFIAALAAGAGVHASIHMDGSTGVLSIVFPKELKELFHLALYVLAQWGIQMAYYHQVVKQPNEAVEVPKAAKTAAAA